MRAPDPNDPSIAKRFKLVVANIKENPKGVPVEVFENLSMDPKDARYVVNVLETESSFVSAEVLNNATDPPADTVIPPTGNNAGNIPDTAKLANGSEGKILGPQRSCLRERPSSSE